MYNSFGRWLSVMLAGVSMALASIAAAQDDFVEVYVNADIYIKDKVNVGKDVICDGPRTDYDSGVIRLYHGGEGILKTVTRKCNGWSSVTGTIEAQVNDDGLVSVTITTNSNGGCGDWLWDPCDWQASDRAPVVESYTLAPGEVGGYYYHFNHDMYLANVDWYFTVFG